MSIKTVLVHVDPGPGCNPRVQLAMHVADLFDADLIGLGAEAFDPVFVSGYAATDGVVIEAIQERIAADLPAAEKHFRALTSGRERIAWVKGVDYPDKLLALNARGADLIVASRPARGESPIFAARLADTIMEAGVPVLLAATTGAAFQGDRIVVAWKDTREFSPRTGRCASISETGEGCRGRCGLWGGRHQERPGRSGRRRPQTCGSRR